MDEELKAWYAELRALERADAPAMAALLARAHGSRRRRRYPTMLAVAAVAATVLVVLWRREVGQRADDPGTAPILQWRAPTDALLATPGGELLRQLPALDRSLLEPARSR